MYEKKSYIEHFKKAGTHLGELDEKRSLCKSNKIISVLKDFTIKNNGLTNLKCLDIGCSAGFITKTLSEEFKETVGIDIDKFAIDIATKDNNSKAKFKVGNALDIPCDNETFDVVVCNHIYEHVPDADKLFSEIYRVLKKKGICYLAAANKYYFMEPHYRLPLLSWLPQNIANVYLRIMKRGRVKLYEERIMSYRDIKKLLLKNNFRFDEYTIKLIKNPEGYSMGDIIKEDSSLSKMPTSMLNLLKPIMPAYIFVLIKE